ncbi:hypothetical protein [Burkholderia cepacia]|uniref:hypothetical protein n=1 Tax=Burkholderia cepacia TaxID=292 RepID=UPI000AA54375|nr:hypothetical protein [Burkholderia cepacia]
MTTQNTSSILRISPVRPGPARKPRRIGRADTRRARRCRALLHFPDQDIFEKGELPSGFLIDNLRHVRMNGWWAAGNIDI